MPRCPIADVETYQTPVFNDERGSFQPILAERVHSELPEVQIWKEVNLSRTRQGALRGLHMQYPEMQAKLVTVVEGRIWDVVVDLRQDSPTYGFWCFYLLAADGPRNQIFVPAGCAHGFCTPESDAVVAYLTDQPWAPDSGITLAWNDPEMGIPWPVAEPILSEKDKRGMTLAALMKSLD